MGDGHYYKYLEIKEFLARNYPGVEISTTSVDLTVGNFFVEAPFAKVDLLDAATMAIRIGFDVRTVSRENNDGENFKDQMSF